VSAQDTLLTFPLTEGCCKELISKSQITPFGKGRDTIVDPGLLPVITSIYILTDIRSGWQIDASKIEFHSTEWEDLFAESGLVLEEIRQVYIGYY
jgi:hypothetical protein